MTNPKVVKVWINNPATDYAAVGLAVVGGWWLRARGVHPLEHLDGAGRLDWLQTVAGVSGVLLGLEITAVTIFFTLSPRSRLGRAMGDAAFDFVRLLRSCLVMLALCTAIFALAGPFYVGGRVTGVSFLLLAATVLVLLRTSRMLSLLFSVLRIFAAEAHDGAHPAAPPLVAGWRPPEIDDEDYALPTAPQQKLRRQRH